MARIFDNIDLKFTEGLKGIITNAGVKRVDFCVGYFNLRGWGLIIDQIDQLPGDVVYEEGDSKQHERTCRLLIGMHQPPEELTRWLYDQNNHRPDAQYVRAQKLKIARDFRKQLQLGLPTADDEQTLRRLSQQLKEKKVCVKLYLRDSLHAKLYLAYRPTDTSNPIMALMGSSNLTWAGLSGNGELNAEFGDRDQTQKLARWFSDRWNDRFCIDITDELIEAIDHSWASEEVIPPYYIYLMTAYYLSEEARNGISEFSLTPQFRQELFPFQQMAVKIAASHLRNDKRGGAIIGDVVGLGKTITACAVAKIFETTYGSCTLIVCPANLVEMWEKYVRKYDLKADIRSMAKDIDVDNARYYRLVIVDESHNLRNGASGRRYRNIKSLIEHQDSRVLLLSATPYNKDFHDISNQLKLFISEDQDLGVRPENYINHLGGERQFVHFHSDTFIRSIAAFEKSDSEEDWSELLKLFMVRRTRTFIKNNYAKTDPADGRKYLEFPDGRRSFFPERIPRSLHFPTTEGDQYSRLYSEAMQKLLHQLFLPRYGLDAYVSEKARQEATEDEQRMLDNLSRAGRRMMGFCKSTIFKRMDSSGFAFLLTLGRHILRNMVFVHAIDNHLPLPIRDLNEMDEEFVDDADAAQETQEEAFGMFTPQSGQVQEEEKPTDQLLKISTELDQYKRLAAVRYGLIAGKNNVRFIDSRYFNRNLKTRLKSDCKVLIEMIKLCGDWNASNDQKLNQLCHLLTYKHPHEKVLVFTQYSDTAAYIHDQLLKRGIPQVGIVTGATTNTTEEVTRFSPVSNDCPYVGESEQYRVMVATDVLSEGQNLQDCHIIVNYDLPWAIIRLIQRAGRVDRIGQKESEILCYSFFPAEGVEGVINLRKRLNDRINQNAGVIGSDEIFFEGNEQNLRDMYNEKAGVLDDADETDVDLTSQAYQIWKNATDANPALKEIIPRLQTMIYSTRQVTMPTDAGVVTYARTNNDFDVLTWLAPDGTTVTNSPRRILQAMACAADTEAVAPLGNHHQLVASAVKQVAESSDQASTSGMLGKALSVRSRIVKYLENCLLQPPSLFFNPDVCEELKMVIDDLYKYPLLDAAKNSLRRMLATKEEAENIVRYVIDLRGEQSLCHLPQEEAQRPDPKVICSMGMRHNP